MNENQKKVSDDYRTNWDSIFVRTKRIEPIPFAGLVDIDESFDTSTNQTNNNHVEPKKDSNDLS
jgi:hypothetical protein